MGQAIDYAFGQWDLLGGYLHEGRLEIDTNQVEPERSGDSLPKAARRASAARQNAIRPTAVGKKNWLFIGHAECGQRGAILFTIVQACRRLGINPFDYLKDVLTQIPHHTNKTVAQLTPDNWLKNRQTPVACAA
jgi:hypothetical protein